MERLQVVGLVSGGKDSCFAMLKCIEYGHQIVALANLMPLDDSVDELDSYMYQTVGHQIVVSYAECMGLPLFRRRIKGSTRHDHLRYTMTPGDEVEDMFILLNEVKRQIPSVTAVSSGAIASDYQRLRVESVCSRLGLVSLAYLWKQDQSLLLQEMITKGIVAIIIKVAAMGLNPAKHLGKDLASLQPHLLQLKEMYGINVCGEGGEYETLTLDCPLFTNARILLDEYQVILHSSGSIAPVGILHPSAFHLEPKEECASSSSCCQGDNAASEKMGCLYEVKGDLLDGFKDQAMDFVSIHVITKGNLITSRTEGDTFSMGCWIQDSSGTSEGLQKDLTAVMKKIESRLGEDGFDWVNVLYIHLYLDDMNEFASANETYVSFIAEKSFHCGVPSRSTIQLPLTQVGLGKAYVEVLVANDTRKRVLHVQSISCWAPSCIGPYSQATLHKEVLLMAGQLGLHPPTMTLCPGGPRAELEQALRNCEAVAECFNCTLSASAILFVIYCSESVTSSGRAEIQDKQEALLVKQSHRQISKVPNPVFLYVLVPNLPKRALVEVKPVLYVPEITESTSQTDTMPHMNVSNCWGYEHLEWHDSCCKKYVIWGKICMAIVSVTNEVVAKLRSETNQNMGDDSAYFGTEANMRRAARFLISLLHQILLEHGFSWQDIMNLRIYFSTELDLAMSILRMVFTEAFREFAGITHRTETGKECSFSFIPVLGSGNSTDFSDLITCELFATKL